MKPVMTPLACPVTASFVTAVSSSGLVSTSTLNKEIERSVLRSRDALESEAEVDPFKNLFHIVVG